MASDGEQLDASATTRSGSNSTALPAGMGRLVRRHRPKPRDLCAGLAAAAGPLPLAAAPRRGRSFQSYLQLLAGAADRERAGTRAGGSPPDHQPSFRPHSKRAVQGCGRGSGAADLRFPCGPDIRLGRVCVYLRGLGPPRLAPDARDRHAGLRLGLPHGLLQFLSESRAVLLGPGSGVGMEALAARRRGAHSGAGVSRQRCCR